MLETELNNLLANAPDMSSCLKPRKTHQITDLHKKTPCHLCVIAICCIPCGKYCSYVSNTKLLHPAEF